MVRLVRRVALCVAFELLCSTLSGRASAATPRPGQFNQAMVDTLGAALKRQGVDAATTARTITRYNGEVTRLESACSGSIGASSRTAQQLIQCLSALPFPQQVGASGVHPNCENGSGVSVAYCGGSFGGGGASGSWGATDCSALSLSFDASGNLIIPSYGLKPGGPIYLGGQQVWVSANDPGTGNGPVIADSRQAVVLRYLHVQDLNKDRRDWWGIIGVDANNCVSYASVAWRDSNGAIHPRQSGSGFCPPTEYLNNTTYGQPNVKCPQSGDGGGSGFDYYGEQGATASGNMMKGCVEYAPNGAISATGYAINEKTTLSWSTPGWPLNVAPGWQECLMDPKFLARITDAVHKSATQQAGYDGAPYSPVTDADSRPGDTKVADLGTDPSNSTATPGTHVDDPPPTDTGGGTTTPPSSGTINADFGSGPADPSAPEMPSILDPVMNWFPSVPQLTLNTSGASCPTWQLNLTAILGSTAVYTMDKQCELAEQVRSTLGAIMVVVWGIGAAVIILRA